jgi:hypothetical protein
MRPAMKPTLQVLLTVALAAIPNLALAASSGASHTASPPVSPAKPAATSAIAGRWEADMQGDGKLFTFVFDFTSHGDSLGGVLGIRNREGEVAITGTFKNNRVHFEQFGLWNGSLEGSSLKLTRGLDGGKVQHMTAHRVTRP